MNPYANGVQVMEYRAFEHKKLPSNLKAQPEIEVQADNILIARAGSKNRQARLANAPTDEVTA